MVSVWLAKITQENHHMQFLDYVPTDDLEEVVESEIKYGCFYLIVFETNHYMKRVALPSVVLACSYLIALHWFGFFCQIYIFCKITMSNVRMRWHFEMLFSTYDIKALL